MSTQRTEEEPCVPPRVGVVVEEGGQRVVSLFLLGCFDLARDVGLELPNERAQRRFVFGFIVLGRVQRRGFGFAFALGFVLFG